MSISKLAFEVAFHQLSSQKEDLKSIRNQATFGAAVNGLVATVFVRFLGGDVSAFLQKGPAFLWFGLGGWLLLIVFSSSLIFSILVITSWRKVVFDLSPKFILSSAESGDTLSEIQKKLSEDAEKYFDENESVLSEAKSYLWWSLVLSWCQIPAWLLLIYS